MANAKNLDLTTRSIRDNLVIQNTEENETESESDIEEKCYLLTQADLKAVQIEHAHCVGKPVNFGNKQGRNIVAKVSSKARSCQVLMTSLAKV